MPKTLSISRNELRNIPPVPFTKTWNPWHHHDVNNFIEREVGNAGLTIHNPRYEASANGMDLFAHFGVAVNDTVNGHVVRQIGWRNSMQKNFALGMVAGMHVTVCSNMSFYGDYKEVRVHRSNLDQSALEYFIQGSIRSIQRDFSIQDQMLTKLALTSISDDEKKSLVFDLMANGVINPSQFMQFLTHLEDEQKTHDDLEGALTLNHMYGAVTRTLRGQSTRQIMDRTRKLDQILINA